DAVDELGLADGLELLRAFRLVHRPALQEDSRPHIVAARHVGQQLVEQVPRRKTQQPLPGVPGRRQVRPGVLRPPPEMMVRIDDRQPWLEDRLGDRRSLCLAGHGAFSLAMTGWARSTLGSGATARESSRPGLRKINHQATKDTNRA